MRRYSLRSISNILPAATGMLLLATGCWHRPAAPASTQTTPVAAPVAFVDSAACAECHSAECKTQSHSRHAQTLSVVSRRELGKLAPPIGPIPGTGFVLKQADDRFVVAYPAQSDQVAPLDYALGSGKTGMTYVFVVERERLAEFRSSYFPHQKQWYVTPGQELLDADSLAKIHPREDARRCLLCHAVTLPDDTLGPQKQFFGVGCESCHGPGSAHIAAVRAGNYRDLQMEKMATWPASRLNDMCGRCHGTESEVQQKHLPRDMTNRLQAYGLTQSQCYKQSKETLSCITCHDPHTNVSTKAKDYEAVCLRCHSASNSAQRPPDLRTAKIKPCPVNPTAGCIGCHMPDRQAIPNTKLPVFMADHFIRVFPQSRQRN